MCFAKTLQLLLIAILRSFPHILIHSTRPHSSPQESKKWDGLSLLNSEFWKTQTSSTPSLKLQPQRNFGGGKSHWLLHNLLQNDKDKQKSQNANGRSAAYERQFKMKPLSHGKFYSAFLSSYQQKNIFKISKFKNCFPRKDQV